MCAATRDHILFFDNSALHTDVPQSLAHTYTGARTPSEIERGKEREREDESQEEKRQKETEFGWRWSGSVSRAKGVAQVFIDFASYFVQSPECHVGIFISLQIFAFSHFPSSLSFGRRTECVCMCVCVCFCFVAVPSSKYIEHWIVFHFSSAENGRHPKCVFRRLLFSGYHSETVDWWKLKTVFPFFPISFDAANQWSGLGCAVCRIGSSANLNLADERQIAHIKLNLLRNVIGCWLLFELQSSLSLPLPHSTRQFCDLQTLAFSSCLRCLSTWFDDSTASAQRRTHTMSGCDASPHVPNNHICIQHRDQQTEPNRTEHVSSFLCNDWWIINFLSIFFSRQSHVIFHHYRAEHAPHAEHAETEKSIFSACALASVGWPCLRATVDDFMPLSPTRIFVFIYIFA